MSYTSEDEGKKLGEFHLCQRGPPPLVSIRQLAVRMLRCEVVFVSVEQLLRARGAES